MRAILTYHSIDPSGSPISVDAAAFARHVEFLASGRVRVVPLGEIERVPEGEDAVALTFDDGFRNFADDAWPRLRDAGLPVTVFVVAGRAGGDNRWNGREEKGIPVAPLMDWATTARVASEGASLGSHATTHAPLPSLGDAALREELRGSRDRIERETGVRPRTFAYPFGSHDARTRAAVAREYQAACTTELRLLGAREDPAALPRLDAFYLRGPGRLESFGAPSFRRYVARRALLRSVRERFLGGYGSGAARAAPPLPSGRGGPSI